MSDLNLKSKINLFVKYILLFVVLNSIWFCNLSDDPDKILSQYKIGSKFDSLQISKNEIFFQFKSDKKISNINIMLGGYAHPKKYLGENQRLVMVDKGEYIVYLYFDEKDILIGKEIVGS